MMDASLNNRLQSLKTIIQIYNVKRICLHDNATELTATTKVGFSDDNTEKTSQFNSIVLHKIIRNLD